jgi:hypothetical protein
MENETKLIQATNQIPKNYQKYNKFKFIISHCINLCEKRK